MRLNPGLRVLMILSLIFMSASPVAADDDDDDDEGEIELLTEETAAVTAGDTAWLAPNWTAEDGTVTDVALKLRKDPGKGVVVTYPTNTGTYTGLMIGHVRPKVGGSHPLSPTPENPCYGRDSRRFGAVSGSGSTPGEFG